MVVVTFSGVPMLGGMVIRGRTAWILLVIKVSLTSEVIKLDLPAPSSPQTHIRTVFHPISLVAPVSGAQEETYRLRPFLGSNSHLKLTISS